MTRSAVTVEVPAGHAFLLPSKEGGGPLAIVDLATVETGLVNALTVDSGLTANTLAIGVVHNVGFYGGTYASASPLAQSDPAVCCSFGDRKQFGSGQTYVLGSYIDPGMLPDSAAGIVAQGLGPIASVSDVQPISEQVELWLKDPFGAGKNLVPYWRSPGSSLGCPSDNGTTGSNGGGMEDGFLGADPTLLLLPAQAGVKLTSGGTAYILQNATLLEWYQGGSSAAYQGAYSFPETGTLNVAAQNCRFEYVNGGPTPAAAPNPSDGTNGHLLVGYWEANQFQTKSYLPLKNTAPQFDVIIVQGTTVVSGANATVHFSPSAGQTEAAIQGDINYLHGQGRRVLLSVGGTPQAPAHFYSSVDATNFVTSVLNLVQQYGFDGIEVDAANFSLSLAKGDVDVNHPSTAAIVNLISAIQQLRTQLGSQSLIIETAASTHIQGGFTSYAGTNGAFLPVISGTRSILSLLQTRFYDTAPLAALDGNFYVPGTADYQVAMTDMLLTGFSVGGNPFNYFAPFAPKNLVIGLACCGAAARNFAAIGSVANAWSYLTGGTPAPGRYTLGTPGGYPNLNGIATATVGEDYWSSYQFSNVLGPLLHHMPLLTTGNDCTYTLSASVAEMPATGGSASVNVMTSAGCQWTGKLMSGADWLTIASGGNGSGSGAIQVAGAANSGLARSAVLAVGGSLFSVHQDAGGSLTQLLADRTPVLGLGAKFVVFDPKRQVLYVSSAGLSKHYPNTVAIVEPSAGKVLSWIPTDPFPNRLALSGDGRYLYVGLENGSLIDRID